MTANTSFIEVLADLEHWQWIEFMNYLNQILKNGMTFQDYAQDCEIRGLFMPYEALTEQQKNSDRKFANRVWDKFNEYYKIEPRNV